MFENGVTQKELAEKLSYTPQHVSLVIKGERKLTDDAARRIAALFPPIRAEWLMGLDNFKTNAELIKAELASAVEELTTISKFLSLAAQRINLNLVRVQENSFQIVKEGGILANLSENDYISFSEEVLHYAEYLLSKFAQNIIDRKE